MQDFLSDFRNTIEDAAARLLSLSEKDSETPREAGKWSPKEILGHLIDSATNNHVRFVKAQLTEDLLFPGYEQEEWVRLQRYNEEPWTLLVQLWRHYNLHLAHVMAAIPETSLKTARKEHHLDQIAWRTVPKDQPVTLEYLIRDYADHLKHHLRQILGQ